MCECKKGDRVEFKMRGFWFEGVLLENPRLDTTHVVWVGNDWHYVQPPGLHNETIKKIDKKG